MNKVLIVDNEKSKRMLYHDELTEEGYSVIPLVDGSKLLEDIEQKRPNIIVLGYSLTEALAGID